MNFTSKDHTGARVVGWTSGMVLISTSKDYKGDGTYLLHFVSRGVVLCSP